MTNSNTGWAPVVHGRTYRVDFRPYLLVVPKWDEFGDEDIAEVREFIRTSTRSAERLPEGPRWLLVKTGRFLVAGVTCMAEAVSADMTHDCPDPGSGGTGRPLYVFLGWATRDLKADAPPMDLEVYKPLYQFVRNRWYDKLSDDAPDKVEAMVDRFPALPAASQTEELTPDPDGLFSRSPILRVCPDSRRAALWAAAARCPGRVSLCIGMARSRDAEDSPVGNITVAGSDEPATSHRKLKPADTTKGDQDSGTRAPGGAYVSDLPPRQRGRSIAASLLNLILKALEAVLRMLGLDGGPQLKALPAPTAPVVGMGEVLRPVQRTAGRPKADAFDAFGGPPLDAGTTSPSPPSVVLGSGERLKEVSASVDLTASDSPERLAPSGGPHHGAPPLGDAARRPTNEERLEQQRRMNSEKKSHEETDS